MSGGKGMPEGGASQLPLAVPEGLRPMVEALLFAAREPVPLRRLAEICGASEAEVGAALQAVREHLAGEEHGLEVAEVAGGFRLFTKRRFAAQVEALLAEARPRLSPAALETLAVIAYRQPIARADVEALRGVQCDHVIRQLLERQLIRVVGRKDAPGRPFLYGTTPAFLEHFGLRDLSELPPSPSFGGA